MRHFVHAGLMLLLSAPVSMAASGSVPVPAPDATSAVGHAVPAARASRPDCLYFARFASALMGHACLTGAMDASARPDKPAQPRIAPAGQ